MSRSPHSGGLIRLFKLLGLIVVTLYGLFILALRSPWLRTPAAWKKEIARSTQLWGKRCCWVLGIEVSVQGDMAPPTVPVFLTPNHWGYCDIPAIAATRHVLFVTRAELHSWPLIGWLLKGINLPYISRSSARVLQTANRSLVESFEAGVTVCAFLEGTSTGGDKVLPFRSPLLESALETQTSVQPVVIRWEACDPEINPAEEIAYWKDHVFVPHLWNFLGLKGMKAQIIYGPEIRAASVPGRQELAEAAHRWVVEEHLSTGKFDNHETP